MFRFTSDFVVTSDQANNSISIKLKEQPKPACKCFTFSDNKNGSFNVSVDQTLLT